MKNFTREQVLQAIQGSQGLVTVVMENLIANTGLSANWNTADRYIKKWQSTREAFEAEKHRTTDFVKNMLMQRIREGSDSLIRFYLRSKDKEFMEKSAVYNMTGSTELSDDAKQRLESVFNQTPVETFPEPDIEESEEENLLEDQERVPEKDQIKGL